ncbi:hypothetical protein GGI03_006158, partial [Coemansia sp. RSA 2337]
MLRVCSRVRPVGHKKPLANAAATSVYRTIVHQFSTCQTVSTQTRFAQWIDASTGKLDTSALETKWKARWAEIKALERQQQRTSTELSAKDIEQLFYVLVMFPYPSG